MNVILSWLFKCSLNFRADNHLQMAERKKKKWKIVLKAFFSFHNSNLKKKPRVLQIYGGKLSILRAQHSNDAF